MKKVKDIIKVMEKFAPSYLKESYDNIGLMVGSNDKEVKKILLALDATLDVINEAVSKDVDLIITHHPLIFKKPSSITMDSLQGEKIITLIKNDISLYSSHTNLDSVTGGINETIAKLIGLDTSSLIHESSSYNEKSCGLGRIQKLNKTITLDEMISKVKAVFNVNSLRVVKGKDTVSKVAVINGSGQDFIAKAVKMGADCIITGDTTYHFASDYLEMGISIIDLGHFASEWIVFLKVIEEATKDIKEVEFITSENVRDPYTFV
ncbi:MAG: Nif3-like dinuclear metal center hexameric protein [Clostridium sp.]